MAVFYNSQDNQGCSLPLPFNAFLDPSNPLEFLEYAFNFVSRNSDIFRSDSAEEKIVSLVHSVQKAFKNTEGKTEEVDEHKKKKKLHEPNKANGLDMENHSWGQNLQEVNATIPVPPGTGCKLIVCEMKKDHLKVGLKGEKPIIDGELFEAVKLNDSFWSLEDNKAVCVLMTKGKHQWWDSLFKGGPEVDTRKAEPEPCELSDWDSESRSVLQKMVFDQRQKQLGLPTSDEIKSQQVLEQFMAENPNMDFFGAKFM